MRDRKFRQRLRPSLWTVCALLAAAGANRLSIGQESANAEALMLDSNTSGDWPGYGRTFGEQHFSPLSQIDQHSVNRLGLAWYLDLGPASPYTQPIAVDGVLYFSQGMSIVHAVAAQTGKLLWRYDPQVSQNGGSELRWFWGTRGIAWWKGKVYTSTGDGRLIALDAKTGKPVWSAQVTERGNGQYITGAPRAFDDKIVIGEAGGDVSATRGFASAYDARTGRLLWRFYTVPGNPAKGFENKAMEMAARTWSGEWWKYGGGGEPWNAFAYDPETRTVLVGTGNGYPWNSKIRSPGGGDNLFLCSLVALDANTGAYKWHYQFNPAESWDYNGAMDIELADLAIDGKPRKVAMTAPKNGFFYVIDRTRGKLISAEKIAKVTWASRIDLTSGRPVEDTNDHFPDGQDFEMWPSSRGAHSSMPMAYSPVTKLAYIPKIEMGFTVNDRGVTPDSAWTVNFGPPKPNPLQNTSALLAWDPATQSKAWAVATRGGINGGILATAGNLVFQGQIDGRFIAYNASNGQELWSFPAQAPVLAAPISYMAGGKQYLTVMVGTGSGAGTAPISFGDIVVDYRTQRKRALTFVLDGSAQLPTAPAPFVLEPVVDSDYRDDPVLEVRGARLFMQTCYLCHGPGAVSGGSAPDLRGSQVPLAAEAFAAVVRDGALAVNGMPKMPDLSTDDLAALRQYIRARTAELRQSRQ
jgi:quinohemoprotein ethanol dehydrogenase